MELLVSHRAPPRVADRGTPPRYGWYRGNQIPGVDKNWLGEGTPNSKPNMEEFHKDAITVQGNGTPVPALFGSELAGSRASLSDNRSVAGVAEMAPAAYTATSAGN